MSQPPKTYRVYALGGPFNEVGVEEIEAAGDDEAIAAVKAGHICDRCEIWDGRRLVAELEGERRQA